LDDLRDPLGDDSDGSVLSEEEYRELHSRMELDESLSSELYEDSEAVPNQPSWVELRRGAPDPAVCEMTVRPERGKLDEDEWLTLEQLLEDNGIESLSLSLQNVVLDAAASHFLCRLNASDSVRLRELSMENVYFSHRSSNEEHFGLFAFGQNEGGEGVPANAVAVGVGVGGAVVSAFDLSSFCSALAENVCLESLTLRSSNLGALVADSASARESVVDLLSKHHGLDRVCLAANGLSDGTLFADALMVRALPLELLDLSFNPIPRADVLSIRWAATRHCADDHFVLSAPFANAQRDGAPAMSLRMEPTDDRDADDRDERDFMESLFPISAARREWAFGRRLLDEPQEAEMDGLGRIELGIHIVAPQSLSSRRRAVCSEFVFVAPEGDAASDALSDAVGAEQQIPPQPGTLRRDGERAVRPVRASGSLMLRI